jgi:hypothetical protein
LIVDLKGWFYETCNALGRLALGAWPDFSTENAKMENGKPGLIN